MTSRTNLIRFALFFAVLGLVFFMFYTPKKQLGLADQFPFQAASDSAFNERMNQSSKEWRQNQATQREPWLKELSLPKSLSCFMAITEELCSYQAGLKNNVNGCDSELYEENLSDKKKFQTLIKGFKVFPINDRFILAKEGKMDGSGPCMFAFFDKNNMLTNFIYDTCGLGNGDNYGDMHLEDWNKDGTPELIVSKRPTYTADGRFTQQRIFDVTSFDNNIVEIFNYQSSNSLGMKSSEDVRGIAEINRATIEFERPDAFKLTNKSWLNIEELKEGENGYERQKAYLENLKRDTTTTVEHYKQNKVSLKYVKIN
jgi:hypothetical protein